MTPVIVAAFFVGIFLIGMYIGWMLGKEGRTSKEEKEKLLGQLDKIHEMYEDIMTENVALRERLRINKIIDPTKE